MSHLWTDLWITPCQYDIGHSDRDISHTTPVDNPVDIPLSVDKAVDKSSFGPFSVDNAVNPPVDNFQESAIYQGFCKTPVVFTFFGPF